MSDHHATSTETPAPEHQPVDFGEWLEAILFNSRWILAPMYLGLVIALVLYAVKFGISLYEILRDFMHISEPQLLVGILDLVDISMIGNLVVFTIIGSYSIFVRKMRIKKNTARPQWLEGIDSATIKVKMGMSLIGVSSIYLLKSFLDVKSMSTFELGGQIAIHLVFVVSTIALAWTSRLSHAAPHHDSHDRKDNGNENH